MKVSLTEHPLRIIEHRIRRRLTKFSNKRITYLLHFKVVAALRDEINQLIAEKIVARAAIEICEPDMWHFVVRVVVEDGTVSQQWRFGLDKGRLGRLERC